MGLLIILVLGFIIGVIFMNVAKRGSIKPIIITTIIGLLVGITFGMIRVVPTG